MGIKMDAEKREGKGHRKEKGHREKGTEKVIQEKGHRKKENRKRVQEKLKNGRQKNRNGEGMESKHI